MSHQEPIAETAEEEAAMASLRRAAERRESAPPRPPPIRSVEVETLIQRAAARRERWAPRTPSAEPSEPERLQNVPTKHTWCLTATAAELSTGCDPEAIKIAIEGARSGLHCVMLHGAQRSGKSNLATWLAAQACRRRNKLGFWIKAETLGRLWYTKSTSEFERALRVPVLVLDDLGTESRNEETRAMITSLLTEREAMSKLVTIVTQGLTVTSGELNARYGAAVGGRYSDPTTSLSIALDNAWNTPKARTPNGKQ